MQTVLELGQDTQLLLQGVQKSEFDDFKYPALH